MIIISIMAIKNKNIMIKNRKTNRISMNKIQTNKMIIISKIINHKRMVMIKINKNTSRIVVKKIIKIINSLNRKLSFGRK